MAGSNWINLLFWSNLQTSPDLFLDPAGDDKAARFYGAYIGVESSADTRKWLIVRAGEECLHARLELRIQKKGGGSGFQMSEFVADVTKPADEVCGVA